MWMKRMTKTRWIFLAIVDSPVGTGMAPFRYPSSVDTVSSHGMHVVALNTTSVKDEWTGSTVVWLELGRWPFGTVG